MQDRILNCIDCKAEFIFTIGEQEFYERKDLHEPKRCQKCRDRKRREREANEGR